MNGDYFLSRLSQVYTSSIDIYTLYKLTHTNTGSEGNILRSHFS